MPAPGRHAQPARCRREACTRGRLRCRTVARSICPTRQHSPPFRLWYCPEAPSQPPCSLLPQRSRCEPRSTIPACPGYTTRKLQPPPHLVDLVGLSVDLVPALEAGGVKVGLHSRQLVAAGGLHLLRATLLRVGDDQRSTQRRDGRAAAQRQAEAAAVGDLARGPRVVGRVGMVQQGTRKLGSGDGRRCGAGGGRVPNPLYAMPGRWIPLPPSQEPRAGWRGPPGRRREPRAAS